MISSRKDSGKSAINAPSRGIWCRIFNFLTAPFRDDLGLFFILAVFSMTALLLWAPDAIPNLTKRGSWLMAMIWNWLSCWLFTLVAPLFRPKARKIYENILIWLSGILMLGGIVCVYIYRLPFNPEMASIVRATNPSETVEFITNYFSLSLVLLCIGALAIGIAGRLIIKKFKFSFGPVAGGLLLLFTGACIVKGLSRPDGYFDTLTGQLYSIAAIQPSPDLREHVTAAKVETVGDRPDNIVVVIGESLDSRHMSLYGYPLPTTPRLQQLRDTTGRMIVFSDVEAPANHTREAFKGFMSTYREGQDREWYDCTSIPEMMRKGGYSSRWLSNQGSSGKYDGEASQYGRFCDYALFLSNTSLFNPHQDEALINVIDSLGLNTKTPSIDFYHLLGSHTRYDVRYPAGREKFGPHDYSGMSRDKMKIISAYDNSVAYNDSVVTEIFRRYEARDAIMIYFSDHGQDLFESDEDYYGHGRPGDEASAAVARRIPLVVVYTAEFERRHPQTVAMLEQIKDKHFNTNDFITLLSKIASLRATLI